jgi:hypothetical protein
LRGLDLACTTVAGPYLGLSREKWTKRCCKNGLRLRLHGDDISAQRDLKSRRNSMATEKLASEAHL